MTKFVFPPVHAPRSRLSGRVHVGGLPARIPVQVRARDLRGRIRGGGGSGWNGGGDWNGGGGGWNGGGRCGISGGRCGISGRGGGHRLFFPRVRKRTGTVVRTGGRRAFGRNAGMICMRPRRGLHELSSPRPPYPTPLSNWGASAAFATRRSLRPLFALQRPLPPRSHPSRPAPVGGGKKRPVC